MSSECRPAAARSRPTRPARLTQVSFRYIGAPREAVNNLTLEVQPGSELWITGSNASGKSTVLALLAGIIPTVIEGHLEGEVEVSHLAPGMVMQDSGVYLFRTVFEEVAFPLENGGVPESEIGPAVAAALDQVGLEGLVGRQMHTLSGGERQKVAVAAALAVNPDILLLDEPFEQLDPQSVGEVLTLARGHARRGARVVIATREDAHVPPGALQLHLGSEWVGESEDESVPPRAFPGGVAGLPETPSLRFRELTHRFATGGGVEGVSLDVHGGQVVALLGPNGAGKTTIMKHAVGLLRPDSGTVSVIGEDIAAMPVHEVARTVGILFQNPDDQIFNRTVLDEVAWGVTARGEAKDAARERALTALSDVGIDHLANENPHEITGSERQLVALASVVACRPRVLILDEPTKSLDRRGASIVAGTVRRLADEGVAVLLVTHDVAFAERVADGCVVVAGGRVVAQGLTADILGDPSLLSSARLVY